MKHFFKVFCVLILLKKIITSGIPVSRTKITTTNVVNHAFCESSLSAEDKKEKKILEEVHTFAELKHDPEPLFLIPSPFVPQP